MHLKKSRQHFGALRLKLKNLGAYFPSDIFFFLKLTYVHARNWILQRVVPVIISHIYIILQHCCNIINTQICDRIISTTMNDMNKESSRLATYSAPCWPNKVPVLPSQLAREGFYYTGKDDEVACFSCSGRIRNWRVGDTVMDEHKRHYPECTFVQSPQISGNEALCATNTLANYLPVKPVGNHHSQERNNTSLNARVPLMSNASMDNVPVSRVYSDNNLQSTMQDEAAALPGGTRTDCSLIQNQSMPNLSSLRNHLPVAEETNSMLPTISNNSNQSHENVLQFAEPPRHQIMNVEANRMETFSTWPSHYPVRPNQLAAAGFYYLGSGDEVKCFACRGRVLCWDVGDDPMVEHRKHFPDCPFVSQSATSRNVTSASNLNNTKTKLTAEDLRYESKRLETLQNWPKKDKIDIHKMAAVGLYFPGTQDKIVCAFCHGAMINWADGDDPAKEHYKYFADKCPLVKGEKTDNVPLKLEAGKQKSTLQQLNIVTDRPKHVKYASQATRLATFKNWPVNEVQTKDRMAEAGFFYTGKNDQVTCFFCNIGLKNWEQSDNPWEQHARWSDNCGYLRQIKGENYEHQIKREHAQLSSSQTSKEKSSKKKTAPEKKELGYDKRRVTGAMSLPMVMVVLKMGFDRDLVKTVIEEKFKETGDNFPNATDLAMAVLVKQENPGPSSNEGASASSSTPPVRSPTPPQAQPAASNPDTEGDLSALEENRLLKQQRSCKRCKNDANIVFLPCGHMVTCQECASTIKNCVACNEVIRGTVKAFLG